MNESAIDALSKGWLNHHECESDFVCEKLSRMQNPNYLVLTCSDSRIDFHAIFGIKHQGEVFQVRNVGGVFSDDAKAGFTYALRHLNPHVILILHHTECGGYHAMDTTDLEDQLTVHLLANKCFRARENVDEYLKDKEYTSDERHNLIIEEGARIQAARLHGFLQRNYPKIIEEIHKHEKCLIAAMYNLETDDIYLIPPKLEYSEKPRQSIFKCTPNKLTKLTGELHPKIQC